MVSSILLWRVFHGFDWSDDSYYSSIVYRFIQGDSLFQSSWDIHQISTVILFPLFWIYTKILGTTGIILFSRVVFVVIQTVEAIGLFYKFNKKNNCIWSILAALVLLCYESNYGLSYNAMMIESFVMAFLLLPTKEGTHSHFRFLCCGVFSGIAIQSYPSTFLVVICFIVFILLNGKELRWNNIMWYISGGTLVIIYFVVFLSLNSSFEALKSNAHYLFTDPEHGKIIFSIRDHFQNLKDLIGHRGLQILLIADAIAIISWFTKRKISVVLRIALFAILLFYILSQWMDVRVDYGKRQIQYQLFFSVSMVFPTLWLLSRLKWDNIILLFLGGTVASIGVNIATNNGETFYVYPYIISAIATVIYIGKTIQIKRGRLMILMTSFCPLSLSIVSLIAYLFCASINYVYRDSPLDSLNARMETGPAAGIYTTQERASKYEETIEAIANYIPQKGCVLYCKLLPFGYLCNEVKPATPRLWRTNLDYEMFEEYYQNNPDRKPDAIYIVDEDYGITNSGIVIGEYMKSYIDSTPHKTIELQCATIYLFEEDCNDKN